MAIKTEIDIERDFYLMLESSELGKALKGKVYRDEMRPADAMTEDIVCKFIAGIDDQIQSGIVVCNIYVPDQTKKGGKKVKDFNRIGELQRLAMNLLGVTSEYKIATDASMTTIPVEGIEQHMIVLRLKFERISD